MMHTRALLPSCAMIANQVHSATSQDRHRAKNVFQASTAVPEMQKAPFHVSPATKVIFKKNLVPLLVNRARQAALPTLLVLAFANCVCLGHMRTVPGILSVTNASLGALLRHLDRSTVSSALRGSSRTQTGHCSVRNVPLANTSRIPVAHCANNVRLGSPRELQAVRIAMIATLAASQIYQD